MQDNPTAGLDIGALIVVLIMILGPLSLGASHASHMGWEPTAQMQSGPSK